MSASPTPERLEIQAHQQRQRIHRTALELISKVDDAKQHLTVSYNVRRHFAVTSLVTIALSFLAGYVLSGIFTER